jgi:hypothetical protein
LTETGERDLAEYVKRVVKAQGFPLELEATEDLENRGWWVSNNAPFIDPETGIPRSIDLIAMPPDPGEIDSRFDRKSFNWGLVGGLVKNFAIAPEICVECKKSESSAWVFFKSRRRFAHYQIASHFFNPADPLAPDDASMLGYGEISALTAHYASSGLPAFTYSEVRLAREDSRSKSDRTERKGIFTAVMQLVKYIEYSYRQGSRKRHSFLELRYPVIVFDGKMFIATVKAGEIDVAETDHVVLETTYASSDRFDSERELYIDVVSKSKFPELCQTLEKQLCSFLVLFASEAKKHEGYLAMHHDRTSDTH